MDSVASVIHKVGLQLGIILYMGKNYFCILIHFFFFLRKEEVIPLSTESKDWERYIKKSTGSTYDGWPAIHTPILLTSIASMHNYTTWSLCYDIFGLEIQILKESTTGMWHCNCDPAIGGWERQVSHPGDIKNLRYNKHTEDPCATPTKQQMTHYPGSFHMSNTVLKPSIESLLLHPNPAHHTQSVQNILIM